MSKKTIGFIATVVFAGASLASAQSEPAGSAPESASIQQSTTTRTVTGEVVTVTSKLLTIRTSDGRNMTFVVDRDLTSGPDAITVGKQVRVEYRGDQELQAVVVSPIAAKIGEAVEKAGQEIEEAGEAVARKADNGVEARVQTPRATDPAARTSSRELPETAGPLPLLLVAGLSLLGGGLGLSARRS